MNSNQVMFWRKILHSSTQQLNIIHRLYTKKSIKLPIFIVQEKTLLMLEQASLCIIYNLSLISVVECEFLDFLKFAKNPFVGSSLFHHL